MSRKDSTKIGRECGEVRIGRMIVDERAKERCIANQRSARRTAINLLMSSISFDDSKTVEEIVDELLEKRTDVIQEIRKLNWPNTYDRIDVRGYLIATIARIISDRNKI